MVAHFDEETLRNDIISTWGRYGAHCEVYDHIRAKNTDLKLEVDRLRGGKFSERVYLAMKCRAEIAEEKLKLASEALDCVVKNSVVGPDAAMSGLTDCFHVPIDDIEKAEKILAELKGHNTGG